MKKPFIIRLYRMAIGVVRILEGFVILLSLGYYLPKWGITVAKSIDKYRHKNK
jgi:hypothetical protein